MRLWAGEPMVIDTSVAFRWLDHSEDRDDLAVELLRKHARDEVALVAPASLPLELMEMLIRRGVEPAGLSQAVDLLASTELLLAPLEGMLLSESVRIAFEEERPLHDAVFIALAALVSGPLVTADAYQATTTACTVRLIP